MRSTCSMAFMLGSIDDQHLDVFAMQTDVDHLVDGVRLGEVVKHGVVAPGDHGVEGIEHRNEFSCPRSRLVMEGDITSAVRYAPARARLELFEAAEHIMGPKPVKSMSEEEHAVRIRMPQ